MQVAPNLTWPIFVGENRDDHGRNIVALDDRIACAKFGRVFALNLDTPNVGDRELVMNDSADGWFHNVTVFPLISVFPLSVLNAAMPAVL